MAFLLLFSVNVIGIQAYTTTEQLNMGELLLTSSYQQTDVMEQFF